MEPEKPFACTLPDCGMTFTNEDHLHVHTRKHDMILQLGMEQKAAFVADQTPTPTRFIRNCEEVGLFQDLQSVNPFDEGFKRAMLETKQGVLSMEGVSMTEDALHTPHLVFPLEPGDCAQYTANNQRNITISRSSSDETGAVKEYETTTISKLTNEVTTISRLVGKPETADRLTTDDVSIVRHEEVNKETVNETVYTNNVIKIHSNVEIRKDEIIDTHKDFKNPNEINKKVPIMLSQKSIDNVVDSLTKDVIDKDIKKRKVKNEVKEDIEVIIKLPDGKHVRMRAVEENDKTINMKEKLKSVIVNKNSKQASVNSLAQLPAANGVLIPVTLVNTNVVKTFPKIPIPPLKVETNHKAFKSKAKDASEAKDKKDNKGLCSQLEGKSAASKRYRERFKQKIRWQDEENRQLKELNRRLVAEKAALQLIITEHMKRCTNSEDLSRRLSEEIAAGGTVHIRGVNVERR